MSAPDETAMQAQIEDALSRVLRDGGYMVTKWAVLAEVIDAEDGERGVWMVAPETQVAWDTLGLLEYARQCEAAETVLRRFESEEEENG